MVSALVLSTAIMLGPVDDQSPLRACLLLCFPPNCRPGDDQSLLFYVFLSKLPRGLTRCALCLLSDEVKADGADRRTLHNKMLPFSLKPSYISAESAAFVRCPAWTLGCSHGCLSISPLGNLWSLVRV